tara:strand:- start:114 stop:1022 length:909 start_codon:yes stop_codon:yes gene_type:complete
MNNIIIGIPYETLEYQKNIPLIPRDIKLLLTIFNIQIYMHNKIFDYLFYTKEDYINAGANILHNIADLYDKCDVIIKINELHESEYYLLNNKHTIICFIKTDKFINYCSNNYINCIDYNTINDKIINYIYKINIKSLLHEFNFDINNSNILIIGYNNISKYYIENIEKLNINYTICSLNYDYKFSSNYYILNNRNLKKLLYNSKIIINFTTINSKLLNFIDKDTLYIQYFDNFNYNIIKEKYYMTYNINNSFLNLYPHLISNKISELLYNYISNIILNKNNINYTIYKNIIIDDKIHKDFII